MAYLSAVLYTFSAYHLFDWYNRGALGEAFRSLSCLLFFWVFTRLLKGIIADGTC